MKNMTTSSYGSQRLLLAGGCLECLIAEHKQLGWKSRWSKMDGEK